MLHPRLSHSFRLFDAIDVSPEGGWAQTFYSTHLDSYADRGFATARLDVSTQLIGELDLPGLPRVFHRLEPKIGGAFISDVGQKRNPLFVPATITPQERIRQLSLDNVVLDSSDRVDEAQIVQVGFGNRFFVDGWQGPELRAELDLSGGFDFSARGTGEFQQVIADGALFAGSGIQADFNVAYDIEEEEISQGMFEFTVATPKWLPFKKGSYLGGGYRYRRDVPLFFENFEIGDDFEEFKATYDRIDQVTANTRLRLTDRWALAYQAGYSFENSVRFRNRGTLEFTSGCKCWAIQVSVSEDRTRGVEGTLNFTILGFGQDLTNPFKGGGLVGSDLY
jgi:hypothetical protein